MADMEELMKKYPSLAKVYAKDVESHDGREDLVLAYLKAHPSRENFKADPAVLLAAIDHFAAQDEFLINIGSDKARILYDMIQKEKPKVLVEIGAYIGYSAVLFAHAMRTARPNEQVKVISLELSEDFTKIVKDVVELAGLEDFVQVISGDASEGLIKIADQFGPGSVDVLFLDHDEGRYTKEFQHAVEQLKLLRPSSVVIADNVVRPGAPEYREYIRSLENWESHGVPGLIVPGEFEVRMCGFSLLAC